MKNIFYLSTALLFSSFIIAQSIEFTGHMNFSNMFEEGRGFELSSNIEISNKLELQPTIGLTFYYNNDTLESNGGTNVQTWEARDIFYTFGSGIYYKLLSKEKYKITFGPKIDMVYFPKVTSFIGSNNVISPSELRFYSGINATFKHNLGNNIGYKVFFEYGYLSKSRLVEGIDYQDNFQGRLYSTLSVLKSGIGVFYLFK